MNATQLFPNVVCDSHHFFLSTFPCRTENFRTENLVTCINPAIVDILYKCKRCNQVCKYSNLLGDYTIS